MWKSKADLYAAIGFSIAAAAYLWSAIELRLTSGEVKLSYLGLAVLMVMLALWCWRAHRRRGETNVEL